MRLKDKVLERIQNEADYCMSEEFVKSKDKLQRKIDKLILKLIKLIEKQIDIELK